MVVKSASMGSGDQADGNVQSRDQAPRHAPPAIISPTRPNSIPPLDIAAAVSAAEEELLDDEGSDGSASGLSGGRYTSRVLV
jgi:hypothetical protein